MFKTIQNFILQQKNRQTPASSHSAKSLFEFWNTQGLANVIPPDTEHPAGWNEVHFLQKVMTLIGKPDAKIVEIGCGYGRLCGTFEPANYMGCDINAQAIKQAKTNFPDHHFTTIDYTQPYPTSDISLAYTVLLHIPDTLIEQTVQNLCEASNSILIVEILGQKWRKPNHRVPVFNRERHEYELFFAKHNHTLQVEIKKPYLRYPNTDISFLWFEKMK